MIDTMFPLDQHAVRLGRKAYQAGLKRDANPFSIDTEYWQSACWIYGYESEDLERRQMKNKVSAMGPIFTDEDYDWTDGVLA